MKNHWVFDIFSCTFAARCCFVCSLFTWALVVDGEPDCGGDIYLNKTAFISSPQYPSVASRGVKCSWRIKSPAGKSIVKDDCSNGKLEIFNGCGLDRFLVEKICLRHNDNPKGILWVSSGSCVTVNFSSGQRDDNKFHLSVAESNIASCGDILGTDNKNHTFAGSLPANPGNNNKCVWIIVVPKGRIELVFKDRFQVTSHHRDCKENFVQVQDGRYSNSPLLGTFCGTSRPYPVYSTGHYLRVTLHGSKTGIASKHSFKAQYTIVDGTPPSPAEYCDGDIDLPSIKSGTFHTPRNLEHEFDVEGDSQECPDNSDYAQVYNGLASWSPIIGRYCGKVIPSTIKSESNKLRIEFRSNTQYAGRGFDAVFTIQSDKQAVQSRNHFTGIMIGTTCGIIFIVLSVLAVFHTRKLRRQREQSRRSEVASTASFDVHQANAPPSYETVMASPDLFPSKERQQSRGYAGVPHLHREISHLLGGPESDDEDLPPYPGLPGRDGVVEFCFGPPSEERERRRSSHSKERHVSESEQPSCQISAVWYRRWPTSASSSPNVRDLESGSGKSGDNCNSRAAETPRKHPDHNWNGWTRVAVL
ncbi:hypothetical protein OS493_003748 [Desmophyllum pertusum]|uniref:CUB domain-containing protein n=1 Tax=Desmophyllum pertusum TaxID=174260 RepID=A0A9X0A9L5_9CNID|nr:hypothetical protein OS493_003748 [Desmophyllum pertusum]